MRRLPAVSSKNAFSCNFEAGKYDLHTAPKPASPSNDSEYDTARWPRSFSPIGFEIYIF